MNKLTIVALNPTPSSGQYRPTIERLTYRPDQKAEIGWGYQEAGFRFVSRQQLLIRFDSEVQRWTVTNTGSNAVRWYDLKKRNRVVEPGMRAVILSCRAEIRLPDGGGPSPRPISIEIDDPELPRFGRQVRHGGMNTTAMDSVLPVTEVELLRIFRRQLGPGEGDTNSRAAVRRRLLAAVAGIELIEGDYELLPAPVDLVEAAACMGDAREWLSVEALVMRMTRVLKAFDIDARGDTEQKFVDLARLAVDRGFVTAEDWRALPHGLCDHRMDMTA